MAQISPQICSLKRRNLKLTGWLGVRKRIILTDACQKVPESGAKQEGT
jgi:hypothetical protein